MYYFHRSILPAVWEFAFSEAPVEHIGEYLNYLFPVCGDVAISRSLVSLQSLDGRTHLSWYNGRRMSTSGIVNLHGGLPLR